MFPNVSAQDEKILDLYIDDVSICTGEYLKQEIAKRKNISVNIITISYGDIEINDDVLLCTYTSAKFPVLTMRNNSNIITLKIIISNAEIITLKVSVYDTIETTKSLIENKLSILPDIQVLKYNDLMLKNSEILNDIGFHDNDILYLHQYEHFDLKVVTNSNTLNDDYICTTLINTIRDLKCTIEGFYGILMENQTLTFNDIVLDDDCAVLQDYNITYDSVIKLHVNDTVDRLGMQLKIHYNKVLICTVYTHLDDTILQIKQK